MSQPRTPAPWQMATIAEVGWTKYLFRGPKPQPEPLPKPVYFWYEDIGFYRGRKKDAEHILKCVNAFGPKGPIEKLVKEMRNKVIYLIKNCPDMKITSFRIDEIEKAVEDVAALLKEE